MKYYLRIVIFTVRQRFNLLFISYDKFYFQNGTFYLFYNGTFPNYTFPSDPFLFSMTLFIS